MENHCKDIETAVKMDLEGIAAFLLIVISTFSRAGPSSYDIRQQILFD